MAEQLITLEEKGRLLNISLDIECMLQHAHNTRAMWTEEEERFEMVGGYEEPVTEEQFMAEMDQMIRDIEALRNPEVLRDVINNIARKKDGYFAKGRIHYYKKYRTTGTYWEDSYGWNHCTIKARALNSNLVSIGVVWDIEKY